MCLHLKSSVELMAVYQKIISIQGIQKVNYSQSATVQKGFSIAHQSKLKSQGKMKTMIKRINGK